MIASESAPLDQESFTRRFPIPDVVLEEGRLFRYLWHYDLPVSPEEFWPVISNSSRLNRDVGYEQVFYEEREGVLYGSQGEGKLYQRWIEYPFEWSYPVFIRRLREYQEGIIAWNFIQAYLQRTPEGVRVYVHNAASSTSPLAKRFLPAYLEPFGERYGAAFQQAVESIQAGREASAAFSRATLELDETGAEHFEAALQRLLERGLPAVHVDRLRAWIEESDRNDLYRMRPLVVAHQAGVPEEDCIRLFLHGVDSGLFTLTWDVICPHCRGFRRQLPSLVETPPRARCEVCEIEFQNDAERSLEVAFRLHPSIAEIQPVYYCSAEPGARTHILIQGRVQPGRNAVPAALPPGRYRALLRGVEDPLPAEHRRLSSEETTIPELSQEFVIHNPLDRESILSIETAEWSDEALLPGRIFRTQAYRDLFPAERLASDLQIDVGVQTILFADVVGSTRYYDREGDGRAFAEVKRHITCLFECAREENGAIIKTVGDGAMLCFPSPAHGIRAALNAAERLKDPTAEYPLALRLSLHSGRCLAVNFNTGVDYFGQTVNHAAKLQLGAGANEIIVSRSFGENAGVRSELEARGIEPRQTQITNASLPQPLDALLIA